MSFNKKKWVLNENTEDVISNDCFCNNCGKYGHILNQCKMPITSNGVVVFRINPKTKKREYLMIRRKDTLGYMDFMRGKFPIYQKNYIMNMLMQMTVDEKNKIRLRIKDGSMKEKIQILVNGVVSHSDKYDLCTLLDESDNYGIWTEPEWGFPKGRRNSQEKDYECALREFSEETGYPISILNNIRNIVPFDEIFIGSNYKSYRHKYYLMYMSYKDSLCMKSFQKSEVSSMEWKTLDECMNSIRSYNLEKKKILNNIDYCLEKTILSQVGDLSLLP
jgi:8-oxo-dGTP pyrophosphatase MutT (NUDIX family)